jgi:exoribonuclease R
LIIIACLDQKNGMAFNHRRQSQDRVLRRRILEICRGHRLWMDGKAFALFAPQIEEAGGRESSQIFVSENPMESAGTGDYCYVEMTPLQEDEDRAAGLVLCRWDKVYPADVYFDLDMTQWLQTGEENLAGSSHEKITIMYYERKTKNDS